MSIYVENVLKKYDDQKALNEVSFKIDAGEIVGFLGPNGAGKSTMMKIITNYLEADQGTVLVNGFNVRTHAKEVKNSVGYLPEHNPLYLELYIREYLNFHADVHKLRKARVDEVIQQVGLTEVGGKKIAELSKGYRQRVGLAAALLHDPEVLILDEPTTGLDPNQLSDIRQLIISIGKTKTVLLSTHIMQEVEAMCDRVIIIHKGQIVIDKKLKDLLRDDYQVVEVEFDNKLDESTLKKLPDIKEVISEGACTWILKFDTKEDRRAQIFDFAKENDLRTLTIIKKSTSLESLFQSLTTNHLN